MRWIAVNYLFSPRSRCSYKKGTSFCGFEPFDLLHAFIDLFHCRTAKIWNPIGSKSLKTKTNKNSRFSYFGLVKHPMRSLIKLTGNKTKRTTKREKLKKVRKIVQICKISGENLVFSPQISYIIVRWNSVKAVKLCKLTAGVSGDLTKIHHNSSLKYIISPPLQGIEPLTSCMAFTSISTAPSLTNF